MGFICGLTDLCRDFFVCREELTDCRQGRLAVDDSVYVYGFEFFRHKRSEALPG